MVVIKWLMFILIQILFLPFLIIGLIDGIAKEFGRSKKLEVSYSAGQTLQYRWFMHYFQLREDPLTVAFTKAFPCESHFGLWTTVGALVLAQRWFGLRTSMGILPEPGKETISSTAGARVMAFDNILKKYVDQVEQIVLPGVGFDLMALTWTKGKKVKVFEVDQTNTLNIKIQTMKNAGIDHDWISYVPVDYDKESWSEKLLANGFSKNKKTLFIWQSVSHFLPEELVKETLETMVDLGGPGSIIVQDFYSKDFIFDNKSMAVKSQKKNMEKMGEPWVFGLDMSENARESVNSFLTDRGLKMTEYRQFGEMINIEPFYCIVEAEILF